MSEKVWETISPEDRKSFWRPPTIPPMPTRSCGTPLWRRPSRKHRRRWAFEFVYDVDKEASASTQPMIEAYEEQYPGVKTLLDTIEAARGEE